MSFCGRPKEEGGHKPINLSINSETYKGLKKIHDRGGNRSKFIEHAVRPLIRQLDPGESCEVLGLVDKVLNCEVVLALSKQDFETVATLATIGNSLEPFRSLCRGSGDENAVGTMECPLESDEPYEDTVCCAIKRFPEQRKKASDM